MSRGVSQLWERLLLGLRGRQGGSDPSSRRGLSGVDAFERRGLCQFPLIEVALRPIQIWMLCFQ